MHAMTRRQQYVALFALPALAAAVIAAAMLLGATVGGLWLFVFGDDPWPASGALNAGLGLLFLAAVVLTWVSLLRLAYAVGRAEEGRPSFNRAHLALAIGSTLVLGGAIVSRTTGWGRSGSRIDSLVCADFCRAEGFNGSRMPPRDSGDRTCSCTDASGRVVRERSLDEIQRR